MAVKRGPKPKPTAQKVRAGNPGKRRRNSREPKPAASLPLCPEWIPDSASAIWEHLAPKLLELSLLTEMDHDALADLCYFESVKRQAAAELTKSKLLSKNAQGADMKNPLVNVVREMGNLTRLLRAEFGMTPSSRSSLQGSPGKDDDGRAAEEADATKPLRLIQGGKRGR